jgi:hypothetical protein
LKAHREVYPKCVYVSPYVTPKDSFAKSNIDQFEANASGKTLEV